MLPRPWLQVSQSVRRFSKTVWPPWEKGMIWSRWRTTPRSVAGLLPHRRTGMHRDPRFLSRSRSGGFRQEMTTPEARDKLESLTVLGSATPESLCALHPSSRYTELSRSQFLHCEYAIGRPEKDRKDLIGTTFVYSVTCELEVRCHMICVSND